MDQDAVRAIEDCRKEIGYHENHGRVLNE